VALFVVGAVSFLALTQTIVVPVIAASVVAAVLSPTVRRLERHGPGRGIATALVLVVMLAVTVAVIAIVLTGIGSQADAIRSSLGAARSTLTGWASDLGVDPATAGERRP
jgi:predicted PurR-regulated permease PerM